MRGALGRVRRRRLEDPGLHPRRRLCPRDRQMQQGRPVRRAVLRRQGFPDGDQDGEGTILLTGVQVRDRIKHSSVSNTCVRAELSHFEEMICTVFSHQVREWRAVFNDRLARLQDEEADGAGCDAKPGR